MDGLDEGFQFNFILCGRKQIIVEYYWKRTQAQRKNNHEIL